MSDAPRAITDLDEAGALSIVLQGGLSRDNLIETARNCRHWRDVFPRAEIILSVSVSDVLASGRPGVVEDLRLAAAYEHDGLAQAASTALHDCCDRVVLSPGNLPLPPFKDDSGPNNFNLQLAAAKAGLAQARSKYVLRVRSDLIFPDRRFLHQHLQDRDLPRGASSVFEERVLISWLFTLNPFTVERMPFHFSDWFNFGLLSDVRRLWTVAPMPLSDAVFYSSAEHNASSNRRERQFYSRLGIEQHLYFSFFRRVFPDIQLPRHNDPSSAAASMSILADNFTLCDVLASGVFFDKYRQDALSVEKQFHCVTREDWLRLVQDRSAPPEAALDASVEAARAAGFL